MMNEEGYIRSRAGSTEPFRVPDGYFDNFASQLMEKLPERDAVGVPMRRSRLAKFRTIICAAACLCVAVFSLTAYLNRDLFRSGHNSGVMASGSQHDAIGDYEDEYVDYVMMDNADIYAYLSGE